MGFRKSPVGLLNACFGFFPATSSVLGTHKVTSTGKRQGHFFDWQLQCLRGINCIRVFAWRTKHLPQILPDVCIAIRSSVSCRARQDLTSYQGGRGEESKWRTHLWYPPQSTCTKPPSLKNQSHQMGQTPDGWRKSFATLIHDRVTPRGVSEQQGSAGKSRRNLPLWHGSSASQKPWDRPSLTWVKAAL